MTKASCEWCRQVEGDVDLAPPDSEFVIMIGKHCYIHLNDKVMHQLLDICDEDLRWWQQQQQHQATEVTFPAKA